MAGTSLSDLKNRWSLFWIRHLDLQPQRMLEVACEHAGGLAGEGLCIFFSHAADPDLLRQTLAMPGVHSTGLKDRAIGSDLPEDLASDRRIGKYWEPGHIRLPRGAQTVYFAGPWRLVTPAMLAYVLDRSEVERFLVRLSGAWAEVPLGRLRAWRRIGQRSGVLAAFGLLAGAVNGLRAPKATFERLKLLRATLFIRHLDNAPEVLRDSALQHADARGEDEICVFYSHLATPELLRQTLAMDGVGSVGVKDTLSPSSLPDDLADTPNVGRYFHHGAWRVPGHAHHHIYFVGPWRLLTSDMVREAIRDDVVSLYVRVGTGWRAVPLALLVRLRPHVRHFARAMVVLRNGVGRLRLAAAHALLIVAPQQTALAARLAGPGGLEGGSLERILRIMVRPHGEAYVPVPRRVVLVCGNLSPGGAERQVTYTVQGLMEQPLESVTLLCHNLTPETSRKYDFYLPAVRQSGAKAREITPRSVTSAPDTLPPQMRDLIGALPVALATDIANLYWEFRDLKPEVVHAWLDWDNVRAGLAAAMAGVPRILISGRNVNPSHYQLYQPYMDPAYRVLAGLENVTILNNSRAGGDDYADWIGIPRQRVKVIYNAIDFGDRQRQPAERVAQERAALGIPPEAFVLGGVFRFEDEKRPLLWMKAAELVAERLPEAQFVLFGHGSLLPQMKAEVERRSLGGRVHFAGVTDDVITAMSLMDLMMLVSYGEGLPNVVLEAQWAGTPVVCTDVGGSAEALETGQTGWALKTDDPQVLADKVVELAGHRDWLVRARVRGPEHVKQVFSRRRLIDETMTAYGFGANA